MPQPSIAYAIGRVRASVRKPLGEAQLERLLASPSFEDARHTLAEMGWTGAEEEDIGRLSVQMQELACAKIREITPDPELTNLFLLRYDAQNLKTLLKARILGEQPESLSLCGTLSPEILRHAVAEHVYHKLPAAFATVMNSLEKSLVIHINPMEIDAKIDQSYYMMVQETLKKIKSKAAKNYFSAKADLQNAVTFLRLLAMKELDLPMKDLLLPGGTITQAVWLGLWDHPEKMTRMFAPYGKGISTALGAALLNNKAIPALEKEADDYLLSLFRPYRHEPFAIEALIGWLLSHERESGAVRLIMAGKRNGFPEGLIRERLRDAYGR